MKLSELSSPVRLMLYGPPGCGKTYTIGLIAEQGYKVHILSYDNGLATLQNSAWSKAVEENIEVYQCTGISELREFFAGKLIPPASLNLQSVVVIDSASALDAIFREEISESCGIKWEAANLKARGNVQNFYGILGNRWVAIFNNIRRIKSFHFVMTAQFRSTAEYDNDGNPIANTDYFTPEIGTKNFSIGLGEYFDEVWFGRTEGLKKIWETSSIPIRQAIAKSRRGLARAEGKTLIENLFPRIGGSRGNVQTKPAV